MKKILLIHLSLLLTISLFSQTPGGPLAEGRAGKQGSGNGHIYGKVVDSLSKGISDVSVIVLETRTDQQTKKTKDVLVKGETTKANGEFDFEELPTTVKLIRATGFIYAGKK